MKIAVSDFYSILASILTKLNKLGYSDTTITRTELGINTFTRIKDFFTIQVQFISENDGSLPQADAVAMLYDTTESLEERAFSFLILIDIEKIKKRYNLDDTILFLATAILIAHEATHFIYYYELFIKAGADATNYTYNRFRNKLAFNQHGLHPMNCDSLFPNEINEEEQTSNFTNLIINFIEKFTHHHFSPDQPSLNNYKEFYANMVGKALELAIPLIIK